ncbi:YHS domain-containing protein [Pseudoalteromonas sp. JBTF-M23]|uniref:YHS domain-containing protein n=1 Tax=Pseudoalteromonas caenipelagi TaxID=2726988 RepID=A0A849V8C1_9GAMM|nr:YHS domain-containing protein [Pseudoalteromonas caenipelagi]NOU49809.1 YHS domain-containing protein [Pseudoalteromonas caenipelagi]
MNKYENKEAINKFCPRSGKPVEPDSLTQYKGLVVGFCNSGCRDDFARNINNRPNDASYFDVLIKEHGLSTST